MATGEHQREMQNEFHFTLQFNLSGVSNSVAE
jgi:hypothetical protein